jgi:hypothetical protein
VAEASINARFVPLSLTRKIGLPKLRCYAALIVFIFLKKSKSAMSLMSTNAKTKSVLFILTTLNLFLKKRKNSLRKILRPLNFTIFTGPSTLTTNLLVRKVLFFQK